MNSQGSYVRFKVGQPVVPVVSSSQLKRKFHCEACNEEYFGNYDKHCQLHYTHNNSVTNQFQKKFIRVKSNSISDNLSVKKNTRGINRTSFLNGGQFKTQENKKLPSHSGSESIGLETLVRVDGFFCTICDEYIPTDYSDEHCKSKQHYDNFMSVYHMASKPKKSFLTNGSIDPSKNSELMSDDEVFQGDLDSSIQLICSDEMEKDDSERPQIIVKIENDNNDNIGEPNSPNSNDMNVDTQENNQNDGIHEDNTATPVLPNTQNPQRRPLSERLGTIVHKKKKSQNIANYLPKPSSHLVPTRKVFVDSAKPNGDVEK